MSRPQPPRYSVSNPLKSPAREVIFVHPASLGKHIMKTRQSNSAHVHTCPHKHPRRPEWILRRFVTSCKQTTRSKSGKSTSPVAFLASFKTFQNSSDHTGTSIPFPLASGFAAKLKLPAQEHRKQQVRTRPNCLVSFPLSNQVQPSNFSDCNCCPSSAAKAPSLHESC